MPWLETAPMEQRERFVRDHRLALYTMTELSARYGIRRKTGYKWLDRFDQGGREGLGDRSRAPGRCPHKISEAVATLICAARRHHPSWGPGKLLGWLGARHPAVDFPAVSTAGDLLARKGLVKKRRRRRHYLQMKPRGWTPPRIATDPRSGKHKLPSPLRGGAGILAIQRKGQYDLLASHLPQVSLEPLLDGHRQHRPPILLAFTPANDNLMPVEVEVLDSKLQTLLQPQPGPIQEGHNHPHRPLDILEDLARCGSLARGTCSMAPTSMRRT